MTLLELNPKWVTQKEGRQGMGISFDCPCCHKQRLVVMFKNPLDGLDSFNDSNYVDKTVTWIREGDTFETLTLNPSVDASKHKHWHGFIKNGQIT